MATQDDIEMFNFGLKLTEDYDKNGHNWDNQTNSSFASMMIEVCEAGMRIAREKPHVYRPHIPVVSHWDDELHRFVIDGEEPECCNHCGGHKTLKAHSDSLLMQDVEHEYEDFYLIGHKGICNICGLEEGDKIHG